MMISLVFLSVSVISLASGIIILLKRKASYNKLFFILTVAITVWSFGLSLSYIAGDDTACERFLRISDLGLSASFAILLHFILMFTDNSAFLKKRWALICLYLPALFFVIVFSVPNSITPYPYHLLQTENGWINVFHISIWLWLFYFYSIGYMLAGLFLLYQWNRKSSDNDLKKKTPLISSAIITAIVLGIVEAVFRNSLTAIPQITPAIALVPVLTIYHVLKQDQISEREKKKIDYIFLFTNVSVYIILSAIQVITSNYNFTIGGIVFDESVIHGLIVQIQMIISLYLVMKEYRLGFFLTVTMNAINLLCMLILVIKSNSAETAPGIVSYTGVLIIIAFIRSYQVKNATYIEKIDNLNQKLVIDEALYRSVFNQAPVGIAIMQDKSHANNTEFGDATINPTYTKILDRQPDELRNLTWVDITHPDDLQADLEKFNQFKNGEINGYTMEKRFIKPDGSIVYVNMKISPLLGMCEDHSMHLCLIEDITERKQAELALKESMHRESVLLCHLPGLAYRCYNDDAWTMIYVSDGCFNLTGYAPESLLYNKDLSYKDMISPEYRQLLRDEWEKIIAQKQPFKYEYEIITASGERKWVIEMGQGIYNDAGEVEELEGIVLDISDRKAAEDHLRYINEHDMLTGLYNRSCLESLLKKDISKKDGLKRAVISINLSTVQLLTANYGFQYTQNLIKHAAEELSQFCADKRQLFQTYDNQFVFYVTDYQNKNEIVDFCNAIAKNMEDLFVADRIGGGIGVLEMEQNVEADVASILRKLLIASEKSINMFEKVFGVCFYDEELEALLNRETSIRRALSAISVNNNNNELYLQYQPVYDLKTNSVCSFEALARLRTAELGPVPPNEFIPIAENTKLIIPIGEEVIIQAFRFLTKLKELGYDKISVSINISAVQLLQPGFASRIFDLIMQMQVNPKNICIEITESMLVYDYDKINNIIDKLRAAGLHVSIDDFGTGYSSLARLRELKVDCLKLDKYFIDKLFDTDINKTILNDIISMSHKLDRCVIAEGIECESQLQYLKDFNCDRIQGYLISRPLDENDAVAFLRCSAEQKTPAEV